jgi:chemotaxis protein MotB
MTVTAEGLRIELLESDQGTFFDSGSSAVNKSGQEILSLLATELGKLPYKISLEGHTDAKPFSGKGTYSNWELSADRANMARRLMQQAGLRPDQVSQVRGFADQRLRNPKDPIDPSNRRISIIVQYLNQSADEPETSEDKLKSGEEKPSTEKSEGKGNAKKSESGETKKADEKK